MSNSMVQHLEFQALDWHSEDTNDFDTEYDDGSDYSTRYIIIRIRIIRIKVRRTGMGYLTNVYCVCMTGARLLMCMQETMRSCALIWVP